MKKKDYLDELDKDETIMEIYHRFYMNVVTAIIHNVKGLKNVSDAEYRQYIKKTTKDIYNKTSEEALKVNKDIKKNIGKMIKKSADTEIKSMKEAYEYKKVPMIMTKTQLDIVSSTISKTYKEIKKNNAKLPSKAKSEYIKAVNKYSEELVKGDITYQEAVKRATKEVREKGITMSYKRQDGTKVNVEPDVAVKRNLLGNMQDAGNQISEDVAEKLGADGVEISAHFPCAIDHQDIQGRQFKKEEFEKINASLDRPLGEYNCTHFWTPIFLDIQKPLYSKQQLNEMKNAKVTYKGKKISAYDGSQIQRRLENQIRKTKRNIEALEKEGLDAKEEKNRLQHEYKKYREASREMEMEQKYRNLRAF